MKKIFRNIYRILANRHVCTVKGGEMGAFKVVVRKYSATITTTSGDVKWTFYSPTRTFMLLYTAAKAGHIKELHPLCYIIYTAVTAISSDGNAAGEIFKVSTKWVERLFEKSKDAAGKVTDIDNEEAMRAMKNITERANMTRQQRRKAEREAVKKVRS